MHDFGPSHCCRLFRATVFLPLVSQVLPLFRGNHLPPLVVARQNGNHVIEPAKNANDRLPFHTKPKVAFLISSRVAADTMFNMSVTSCVQDGDPKFFEVLSGKKSY
jgi:hypothetical protein